MQFRVAGTAAAARFNLAGVAGRRCRPPSWPPSRRPSCRKRLIRPPTEAATDTYSSIQDTSLTFTRSVATAPVTMPLKPKAIQELFDDYGRMNATLGVELPFTNYPDPDDDSLRLHRSAHRDRLSTVRPSSGRSPITAWTPTPSTSTCSTCR